MLTAKTLSLPRALRKLQELRVRAYHVDFETATVTAYLSQWSDVSRIVKYATFPVDVRWDADMLISELQRSQGGTTYTEMALGLIAAGVVNYTADLESRKIIFRGAAGDIHEWILPSPGFEVGRSDSGSEASRSPGGATRSPGGV